MKYTNFTQILVWSLGILILFSCTIEKRRYLKGYYVGVKNRTEFKKINSVIENNFFHSLSQKEFRLNANYSKSEIYLTEKLESGHHSSTIPVNITQNKKYILNDTCKDELIFKNGERLKVKIVEITPYVVRFYNCTLGSAYVSEISKNDLSLILPHEGKAELIDTPHNNNSTNTNNSEGKGRKIHDEILIGLGLFSILGIFGAIYVLIRYKRVRNEILSNPDKYHGKKLWDLLFYLAIGYVAVALLYILINYVIFEI